MDSLPVEGYSESLKKLIYNPESFAEKFGPSNSMNSTSQNFVFSAPDAVDSQASSKDSRVFSNDSNHNSSSNLSDQRFSFSHQTSLESVTQDVGFGPQVSADSEFLTLDDLNPTYSGSETLYSSYCSMALPSGIGLDVPDFPDACLKYMGDFLMDGDLVDEPTTIEDYRALQATEKSLYDILGESFPIPGDQSQNFLIQNGDSTADDFTLSFLNDEADDLDAHENGSATNLELHQRQNQDGSSPPIDGSPGSSSVSNSHSTESSDNAPDEASGRLADSPAAMISGPDATHLGNFEWIREAILNLGGNRLINPDMASELGKKGNLANGSRGGKNRQRDDDDYEDRCSKHLAPDLEEDVKMELYDDLFLSKEGKDKIHPCMNKSSSGEASGRSSPTENSKGRKGRASRGKKQPEEIDGEAAVDMRNLLIQCAQAVASFDLRTANELLKQIRQHSTPYGDSLQRIAHYFANGLEARLSGTGSGLLVQGCNMKISLAEFLEAYRAYVTAVPFKRTAFFFANKTIVNLAENASRIHIVDFGNHNGIQWPCFIQHLSKRERGPPKLRMTVIDYPQRGYRPASKLEATGRQLAKYADRFGLPFEFHPIAKRWEDVHPEDVTIDRDELLVVNCMFGAGRLFDETVEENSPRDAFLCLVRKLNPDLFLHGIINGALNAPFFITRFKEALFFYSALFDVFEETMCRESKERQFMEKDMYGNLITNVIACEAEERIERPETYKQWQVRHLRAGFKQQQFSREDVNEGKAMLKANYHKNFLVDEDGKWILQGWKGKIMYGVSCWKPVAP